MCAFSHILVLLDCSAVDDVVIGQVLKIATCGYAKVTLTHVVHSHTADQDRFLKKQSETCISTRLLEFREAGIETDFVLLSGEPEVELVKEVNTGKYDLVALATHGHKIFSDILFGSVSDHLKHEVDVPLLMIRGKPDEAVGNSEPAEKSASN